MPLPKVTKYTRAGEVDPGVAAVAAAIKRTFALFNVDWSAFGYTYDPVREGAPSEVVTEIEKLAYFVASRGGGAYQHEVFAEYLSDVPKTGGVAVLRRFEGAVDKEGRPLSVSPYVSKWWEPAHENEAYARTLYGRLLDDQPDRDLLVEALMFYDPTGDFAGEVQAADKPIELARQVAEETASGVPPLGKKWIIAALVSRGKTVAQAREAAYFVYDKGGNYLGWKEQDERREEVRAILIRFDPDVSDEQVDVVARSPVPLGAIEATFRSLAATRGAPSEDEGPGVGTYLALGALAAGGYWFWKMRGG